MTHPDLSDRTLPQMVASSCVLRLLSAEGRVLAVAPLGSLRRGGVVEIADFSTPVLESGTIALVQLELDDVVVIEQLVSRIGAIEFDHYNVRQGDVITFTSLQITVP
jgi:hypothetical protein